MIRCLTLAAVALGLCGLAQAGPAAATLRVDTPGSAFTPVRGKARFDDVADGRRIRGGEHAEVTVAGELRLPSATLAERRAVRLVLHFRTSRSGPRLRKIVLPDGNTVDMDVEGNQMSDNKRNTLEFGDVPLKLYDRSMLKLVIGFPGGIDSHVDPGEFVLKSVSLDVLRKPGAQAADAAREVPPLALDPHRARSDAARSTAAARASFEKPTLDVGAGLARRLDWCRVWGDQCGKPAADAFCAMNGYRRAARFEADMDIGETVVISSRQRCSDPRCDGFARIECE